MKANKISESGLIGQDGKLRMPMERLNQFFAQHKGQRIVMRIEAAEQCSSVAQIAYYYNYVLPTVRQALLEVGERKTEGQTDKWLLEMYPGDKDFIEFWTESGGQVEKARQLSKTQMIDFLEWLKEFAAENLYVYIEDPHNI